MPNKIRLGHMSLILVASMGFAISGCSKSATGQVAAVVNGEEVTLQEINAALSEGNFPEGGDKAAMRNQVLQQIVERRLMAQQAKKDGLDQDPEYLIKQRQGSETLLLQMYAKKAASTVAVPNQKAIDAYTASHPYKFANRTVFGLDQLKFQAPADLTKLKPLQDAHSMTEVKTMLKTMGIQFSEGKGTLDSAQVPDPIMAQISNLPAGEPFIVPQGQVVTVSVVTSKTPSTEAMGSPAAVNMIRNEDTAKILEQRLKDAKANAKIEYQTGFAPKASVKPAVPVKK